MLTPALFPGVDKTLRRYHGALIFDFCWECSSYGVADRDIGLLLIH